MDMKLIRNDEEYEATIEGIERLIDTGAEPNTPEGDKVEILSLLVEAYEKDHYPVPLPDPIEAIKYYMESRGLSRADLEPFIGSRARVSEILNRKRSLSLNMIRKLSKGLGIPTEILVQDYKLEEKKTEFNWTQATYQKSQSIFGWLVAMMTIRKHESDVSSFLQISDSKVNEYWALTDYQDYMYLVVDSKNLNAPVNEVIL